MFNTDASIKKVHWNVQTACNMPCGFCYLWRKPHSVCLQTEVAKELIKQTYECGVKWFVFGGGDPLLREDLSELLEFGKSLGLKIDLQTNAILLTKLNAEAILTHIHQIGLSLDGEDEIVHDTIRSYPGHFQIILNTLSLCERYEIPVTVRTVVCQQNLNQLAKLGGVLNKYSCIQKWSLRQFAPLGRGQLLQNRYSITNEQFSREVQQIIDMNPAAQLKFPIASITIDEMSNCYCIISEDGQVYGHPSDGDYKSIGRFPEESLSTILLRLNFDPAMRAARDLKAHLV